MKKEQIQVALMLATLIPSGLALANIPAAGEAGGQSGKAPAEYRALGQGGKTTLRYGEHMPEVVCSPLRLCVIALERGEVVNSVHVGDKERWMITPTFTGTEELGRTHVVIKPQETEIATSLVIATQRRSYLVTLRSTGDTYMPFVQFSYPVHQDHAWGSFIQQQKAHQATAEKRAEEDQSKALRHHGDRIQHIETNYLVEGKAPWRPTAVYHDGLHTYVKFPATLQGTELPILLVMSTEDEVLQVNYLVQGAVMKIDYVVERGVLVAGVDDEQARVMFTLETGDE
jgi:P-type conjugative transfer protein TrbG